MGGTASQLRFTAVVATVGLKVGNGGRLEGNVTIGNGVKEVGRGANVVVIVGIIVVVTGAIVVVSTVVVGNVSPGDTVM